MADIRLAKPVAGTTQTVPSAPDGRFIFDFPADAATLTRNGDDLVLSFEDGSSIRLQGFYTTYSKEEMPSFQVEGVEISGQDFFAALGEDLMPAAGPAAGSSVSRGGRYNEYGGSDLLDGIDHLGRLDIGFDGGTQLATGTVEPSAPEVDIDYDVTITGGLGADGSELTVYESGLAGGTQAGQEGAPTTATGSLTINAPDGVASIVIGDVVFFANGKLTGNAVSTGEGTLKVTGYDPATGKLEFTYELTGNTTEHDKSDPATDTQISHDLTVTVTDTDGDSASTTITVNVVDDAPTIGAPGEASMEVDESGEASHQAKVDINDFLTVDAGADGEAGRTYKLTLGEGAGENLQAIVDGQVYDIELTLNEEGNRISGTADGEEIFYVSVDEKGEVYLSLTGNGSLKHPDSTSADEGLKLEDIGVQVTVTDGDGDEKSVDVNLDLTIKDDGPTVTVTQGNDAQYGQEVKIGTLDSDYGADGENTLEALQLQIDGKIGVLSNGVYTFAGIGSVRIGEDGQIFFTPLADSGADRDYTLQVTVTDGDDDKDTDSISFRVEGTDLAGVKGSVTGDDANVLTKQTVDVEIPTEQLEALGATLVPNQEVPVMDAQGDVYGKLYVNEDGKVTFVQTKAYTGHTEPDQPDELADGFSGKLKVTLADGTPSSITVDVSIRDDAPVEPGKIDFMTPDGAGNYDDNSPVILFTIGATPGNTKLEGLKFGADVGGEDAPAMLTVKVNGMEFSIEVTRDEDGQLHFSGDDGDTITFTGPEDTGKYGSLSYDKETGIFTYTRPEGDIGGEKNSYDISLTITDADGDAVTVSEDYETVFREPTVIGDTVTTDEGNIIMGGALIGSGGETEVTAPVENTAQGSITVNLDHADGTIVIESPSGKSITITIDKNGDIVEIGNEVIQGKHGYISDVHVSPVTPDGTIKIDYTYTLNTPVDGGNQDNGRGDRHLADEFTVTVTTDGGSATGTITANALDDAPVLEIAPLESVYDTADTIEIPLEKFSVGADVISLAGKTASISVMVGEKKYIFTVSHETNGTYSFTAPDTQDGNLKIVSTGDGGYKIVYTRDGNDISDGVNDSYQFNVTVTDSDGDTATGSVTVDAEVIPPIIDESIHTDLKVDEDGLVHSTGKTDTGQLVVDMHGQAGTVSIGSATVTVGTDGQVVRDGQPVTGGYGNLTITGATLDDGRLTIKYSYDLTKSFTDETGNDGTNTVQDADSFPILINGEAEGSVTVDIVDDVPTLTVSGPEVVESVPDDDNLASGEDVDFVSENKATNISNAGKAVGKAILSETNADWEDVTIYAAHVDYEKMEDGSYAISGEITRPDNYKLEYSQYPTKEKNFADFGLMVRNEVVDNPLTDNAAGGFETNAFVKNGELTGSEAIVIDLGGKTAYGVSLDFGAFYSNFKGNEGQEHVLVTFYKDGKPVGSRVIDAVQNEGGQAVVVHSDQFLSEGFDQVVISALQNTGGKTGQASTFTIQGVGLITAPEPIHQVTGEIAVDSGADGYHAETGEDGTTTSNDFTQAHVRFDMPETLTIETEDGSVELTLEIRTDSAGNSLLTGSADGKEYFSVILEQQEDGSWSWKMDQYEEFLVRGEDGQLGSLELGFITRDGDDDEATGKVDIPLKNLPDLTASETTLVTDESYIADLGSSTEPAEGDDGQANSARASGTMSVNTYGKEGELILTIDGKVFVFQLDADGKLSGTSEELAVTTTYGTLTLTNGEAGKITYTYTQTQPYSHTPGEGPDQSSEAESFTVQVKADGEMSDPATITVSIEDDAPMFSDESFTVDVAKESQKYWSYAQEISFTGNEIANHFDGENKVTMQCGDNTLTLHVGKIQFGADGNIDTSNNWTTFIDGQGKFFINGQNQDLGIGVHSKYEGGADNSLIYQYQYNRQNEIGYDPISRQSEAVIIELDKPAVNMNIDLSQFFSVVGSDTNPEKAIFLFYKDGECVGKSHLSSDEASGDVQQNGFSALPPGGFDTVVIAASDNGVDPNQSYDNSEFNISAITFNKFEGVGRTLTGQLEATSADGIKGYSVDTAKLANLELTSGSKSISYDWDAATGTLLATAGDETVFELVLNTETGAWTMVQYQEYAGTLELPFIATDGDNDSMSISVTIPPTGAESGTYKVTDSDAEKAVLAAAEQEMKSAVRSGEALATAAALAGMVTVLPDDVPAADDRPDTPDETMVMPPVADTDAPVAAPLPEEGVALPDSPVEEMADAPLLFENLALAAQEDSMAPAAGDETAEGLLWADVSGTDDTPDATMSGIATSGPGAAPAGTAVPEIVLTGTDGDDILLGGDGDELIFGGSGDDFIDGGAGRDTIYAGAGNDIIVYDQQDYLVSGGNGIDFMVSDDTSLTLDGLLSNTSSDKPLVSGIEVLLKGEDALSLTSIKDLADRYGITLGVNEAGEETLQLDDRWTKQDDGSYDFNGGAEADGGLTLETSLTPVETGDPASEAVQQQVFTLEHSNG